MTVIGKKLKAVLEGYDNFLRESELEPAKQEAAESAKKKAWEDCLTFKFSGAACPRPL